ncbi:hypothetical protein Vadar_018951 [Vaccinium darrowii]|uniref:Uncharacterized protein n=1 Tax=Vaccinium darrowii TaxID=229202 RepID=A0ACB7XIV2_9ERIC|nr:hypothetical protein Vadar_018951 [Vaccinium darrowii]
MDGGAQYNPRTVEEVFRDFKGRRAGMIKALTSDVEEFYQQCDPEKENLCLYGFPSEQCTCLTKRKAWMRKMKMNMGRPCVGHVGRTTRRMNFGSVAIYVRSGSMASV